MKKTFSLVFVSLALFILIVSSVAAQESYNGRFSFDVPAGYTWSESGADTVRVDGDGNVFFYYGPQTVQALIGELTFTTEEGADDPAGRLAAFLDRTGYALIAGGLAPTLDNGIVASTGVELARRNLKGAGSLVDVGYGREMVVVTMSATGAPRVSNVALNNINYPADILDVASDAGDFSFLLAAIEAAGLEDTLRSGEYTIFAPTDAAFAAMLAEVGAESAVGYFTENAEAVATMLQMHVIEGKVMLPNSSYAMLNGSTLSIGLSVDGSPVNVTSANMEAFNGVIHVIDAILVAPAAEGGE